MPRHTPPIPLPPIPRATNTLGAINPVWDSTLSPQSNPYVFNRLQMTMTPPWMFNEVGAVPIPNSLPPSRPRLRPPPIPRPAEPLPQPTTGNTLRQRYNLYLSEAAGSQSAARIKITPERVARAIEIRDNYQRARSTLESSPTQQSTLARQFVSHAVQNGMNVRKVKMPDGPRGSIYVDVEGVGIVRFSDHAAPLGFAGDERRMIGGYSRDLGRRHFPSVISVAPGDSSLDDAMRLISRPKV